MLDEHLKALLMYEDIYNEKKQFRYKNLGLYIST